MKRQPVCCLAIPLDNVGVYLANLCGLFLSVVTILLSSLAPPIVSTMQVLPSYNHFIVMGIGIFWLLSEMFGILVLVAKTLTLYRAYLRLRICLWLGSLILSMVTTVIIIRGHSISENVCTIRYGNEPKNLGAGFSVPNPLKGAGEKICSLFTFAQIIAVVLLQICINMVVGYLLWIQNKFLKLRVSRAKNNQGFIESQSRFQTQTESSVTSPPPSYYSSIFGRVFP